MAPALGTALLGPAGGFIGNMIGRKLGLTADELVNREEFTDDEYAKIKEIEATLEIELRKAATDDIQNVNRTMQSEARSEHWMQWSWRPFIGFVTGVTFLLTSMFVCFAMYKAVIAGNATMMSHIPAVVGNMTMLFSIPGAILGVASWHRGQEKRIKAGR